jgi:hypothetical protein
MSLMPELADEAVEPLLVEPVEPEPIELLELDDESSVNLPRTSTSWPTYFCSSSVLPVSA